YVRFPTQQFDYSRFAIAEFRADLRPHLSAAARAEMDKAEADDLFAYPDRFPAEWKAFRRARLTALVAGVRPRLRAARPAAPPTAAAPAGAQGATPKRLHGRHAPLSARPRGAGPPLAPPAGCARPPRTN